MMKDFLRKELAAGDKVATMIDGYSYLVMCTILKFTPKMMHLQVPPDSYQKSRGCEGDEVYKTPFQVCKVDA